MMELSAVIEPPITVSEEAVSLESEPMVISVLVMGRALLALKVVLSAITRLPPVTEVVDWELMVDLPFR